MCEQLKLITGFLKTIIPPCSNPSHSYTLDFTTSHSLPCSNLHLTLIPWIFSSCNMVLPLNTLV